MKLSLARLQEPRSFKKRLVVQGDTCLARVWHLDDRLDTCLAWFGGFRGLLPFFPTRARGPNPHTKALIEHACAPLHLTMERKTGLPKKEVPPRWLSGFSGAVCMDGRVPLATQLVNSWGGAGGLRRFSAATSEWERHAAWYCQGFLGGAEARSRPYVSLPPVCWFH